MTDYLGAIKTNATQKIARGPNPSPTGRLRAAAEIEPMHIKELIYFKVAGQAQL